MPEGNDDSVQETPEIKVKRKARDRDSKDKVKDANVIFARALARALWLPQFKAENPEKSRADMIEVWKTLRLEQSRPVVSALRGMARRGYSFTVPTEGEAEDTTTDGDANF